MPRFWQRQNIRFLTFSTNLAEVNALVVEHLDAMRSVVGDEDLLSVVDHHSIGKLQMLGAAELVEDITGLIKDDDAHDFALDDDDAAFVVHCDTAWMLQNVGTEFPHKLPVLVVNLDLERGAKKVVISFYVKTTKKGHKGYLEVNRERERETFYLIAV